MNKIKDISRKKGFNNLTYYFKEKYRPKIGFKTLLSFSVDIEKQKKNQELNEIVDGRYKSEEQEKKSFERNVL